MDKQELENKKERLRNKAKSFTSYTKRSLKEERLRMGLTIAELAYTMGMCKKVLSEIEKGIRPMTFEHFCRIATALGFSMRLEKAKDKNA